MNSMENKEIEEVLDCKPTFPSMQLPSNCQINEVVKVQFREGDNPFTATVRAIHFYVGKVKYDVGLWLGDGSVDDPELETRIYNVDSYFVSKY